MKLLYKDQLRKIKFNLFNFISLSLLVMIISLTFTATKSSISRLEENYEPYLEEQLVEDFQFGMSQIDISYLGGTALWYLCGELDLEYECAYNISVGTPAAYNNLSHAINQEIEVHPDLYEELIVSVYNQVNGALSGVINANWIDRTVLGNSIIINEYDNGTIIIINYTDDEYVYESITINPISYQVIGGN